MTDCSSTAGHEVFSVSYRPNATRPSEIALYKSYSNLFSAEVKFAMARTSSPARETRALPRIRSRHDRRYRSEPRALQPYITLDGHRPRYESEFFTASLRPDRHECLILWAAIC